MRWVGIPLAREEHGDPRQLAAGKTADRVLLRAAGLAAPLLQRAGIREIRRQQAADKARVQSRREIVRLLLGLVPREHVILSQRVETARREQERRKDDERSLPI